ncbi:MAG: radical SAM protein [Geobacteraceae bacterium]|nr:radical SAM protein [Geobacteraceae bacterium]
MQCNYCEWRCDLTGGKPGVCRMYEEAGGAIRERFPHRWSSCISSRIESIPFYHVRPGSRVLVIGTMGCNFSCRYCSNAFIAKEDPTIVQERMLQFSPAEVVRKAKQMGCWSIVFNVNEPAMSFPTLQELAEVARSEGVSLGCLTNAYTTEEATELLASIFSFFNIGLKGLSPTFNREHIGIPSAEPILRNIRRLAATRHVEVTTPIIESVNDGELEQMARFLADVDPEIPWHVFRLLPEDEMKEARYPNVEKIAGALDSVRSILPYVYFHNFVGSEWVNTLCPGCDSVVVERFSLGCGGDRLKAFHCVEKGCPDCGREIRLLGDVAEQWNSREVNR